MRITADQTIEGIPILEIRRVFRLSRGVVSESWLAHRLKISDDRAGKLVKALLRERYIEKQKPGTIGDIGWDLTMRGNALSNASAAKPLTRQTAKRKLDQFLERIEQIRDDDRFLFKVTKAYVFGSFLSEKENIGDIDLAIEITPKEHDPEKFRLLRERKIKEAQRDGRQFKTFIDEAVWPEHEVWLALKARSRSLSLHRFDERMMKVSKHRLIYKDLD